MAQQAGEDWAEEGGMHIFKVVPFCPIAKSKVPLVASSEKSLFQGGQGGWQENDGESIHGHATC